MKPYQPLVSIGIPTYNRPVGLRICLEHITQQTYTNLEIIVSDNCSTIPEVQMLLDDFSKKDKRVKIFFQPENKGMIHNFNFVLEKASGSFFMWAGDDDFIDFNYIEKCIYHLLKDPSYVLVAGQTIIRNDETFSITKLAFDINHTSPLERILEHIRIIYNSKHYPCFYGLRKILQTEKVYLKNRFAEDYFDLMQMAHRGKIKTISETNIYVLQGTSTDDYYYAKSLGYSRLKRYFIHFIHFKNAIVEMYKNSVYSSISFKNKIVFSITYFFTLLRYTKTLRSTIIIIKRCLLKFLFNRVTFKKKITNPLLNTNDYGKS